MNSFIHSSSLHLAVKRIKRCAIATYQTHATRITEIEAILSTLFGRRSITLDCYKRDWNSRFEKGHLHHVEKPHYDDGS